MITPRLLGFLLLGLATAGCQNKQSSDTDATSDASTVAVTDATSNTVTDATSEAASDTTSEATSDATSDTTTDATSVGEPTSTTDGPTSTTGEAPAECACINTDEFGGGSYTCATDGGCGPVEAFCDANNLDEMDVICEGWGAFSVDPVVLDCALDRLIAGTPGLVWWHIGSNGPGDYGGFVDIIGDRAGIGRNYEYFDLGGSDTAAGMVTLKDAAYFEGCKAVSDPELKFTCMRDWWTAPPTNLCDDFSQVSDD